MFHVDFTYFKDLVNFSLLKNITIASFHAVKQSVNVQQLINHQEEKNKYCIYCLSNSHEKAALHHKKSQEFM